MRRKYALDPALPTILLSAGGFGVGPMDEIMQELMQLTTPAQVIALCGRNEELKAKIEALSQSASDTVRIVPVGFTDKVNEYMSASDIVLGKPGGLTTSEALAKHLAFVIVNPIPGQEERNADHLLENGIAIRCNNLPTLAFKLDRLLADWQEVERMQANTAKLACPQSAESIARILAEMPVAEIATTSGAKMGRRRRLIRRLKNAA
jgi:processive 1,2-diacylglycerol beta-glucosyltransferase